MAKYCHERVASPKRFDKKSFRTKPVGKRGHKIVTGCPKGKYSKRSGRCKTSIGLQAILHPEGEKKCPIAGRKIRHKKRRGRRRRNPHMSFKYAWVGYVPRSKAAKAAKILKHEGLLTKITKAPFAGWSEVYLRKGRDVNSARRTLYSHGIMVA